MANKVHEIFEELFNREEIPADVRDAISGNLLIASGYKATSRLITQLPAEKMDELRLAGDDIEKTTTFLRNHFSEKEIQSAFRSAVEEVVITFLGRV